MTEQQLLDLKKKVDRAKTTVSELEGQRKAQMKQLSDDWGCKTVEAAEKKVESMSNDIETLDKQIKKGIEELETKYEV
jgi:hypothetical protein